MAQVSGDFKTQQSIIGYLVVVGEVMVIFTVVVGWQFHYGIMWNDVDPSGSFVVSSVVGIDNVLRL